MKKPIPEHTLAIKIIRLCVRRSIVCSFRQTLESGGKTQKPISIEIPLIVSVAGETFGVLLPNHSATEHNRTSGLNAQSRILSNLSLCRPIVKPLILRSVHLFNFLKFNQFSSVETCSNGPTVSVLTDHKKFMICTFFGICFVVAFTPDERGANDVLMRQLWTDRSKKPIDLNATLLQINRQMGTNPSTNCRIIHPCFYGFSMVA